jgi:hypothetical protein
MLARDFHHLALTLRAGLLSFLTAGLLFAAGLWFGLGLRAVLRGLLAKPVPVALRPRGLFARNSSSACSSETVSGLMSEVSVAFTPS